MSGVPFIFKDEEDVAYFHDHVATALGLEYDACDVLIIGSAKTGFSLDPYNYFVPFHEKSDIDIIVISDALFDEAWHTMLNWDYLTAKNRTKPEQEWLYDRHDEVWSGWHNPPYWELRQRGGMTLSFPAILKPLRISRSCGFRLFVGFRVTGIIRRFHATRRRLAFTALEHMLPCITQPAYGFCAPIS